ncbi:hypothetical protein KC19_8G016200 [Ceratodon purpureus]|uniref:FAD dependent oxidoreductase domain-containing protein n=1 Tax=Ceratodon purpureus TaxID=3225 RepID=A0A8T0GXU5_CERPU|nr:hypothetical protein KC19_8G016200 [Ceratodon purpureus]
MEHERAGRFEVAVIGLGVIGSAACRHLSLSSQSVLGIGPREPHDWKAHTGVFASHYDEGRLTRIVDKDDVWAKLAARSIASYKAVEEESGVKFHYPVGSLRVTPFYKEDGDSMVVAYHTGSRNGAPVELIESGDELGKRFPYFHFEERQAGVMEAGGAGYVNPREMVRAQLEVAAKHGAEIVAETAVKVEAGEGGVRIVTDTGRVFEAAKVLLCTDAYTNLLLPEQDALALTTYLVSVLLAEVDVDEAEKLKGMPSIIWRLRSHPYFHSIYACPPVLYPDGKTCVKIGGTEWKPYSRSSASDFLEWFHSDEGRPVETKFLQEILAELLPETSFKSFSRKSCFVTYTANNYPYIAAADGAKSTAEARVFVCTGGCGAAAKSSDEIGRIGALLVTHRTWEYDLDERLFKGVSAAASKFDAKMIPHV